MFKELPILTCEDDFVKTMNYLILALKAYKAAAEVIFDRLVNVTIVCQIIKPLLTLQRYKNLNWSHQAIFTLLRSATNILLMETLGEFHDLKSKLLESEESVVNDIKGDTSEEKTYKILKWFIQNEIPANPIRSTSLSPNVTRNIKGTEYQKHTLRSLIKRGQDTFKGKKKKS